MRGGPGFAPPWRAQASPSVARRHTMRMHRDGSFGHLVLASLAISLLSVLLTACGGGGGGGSGSGGDGQTAVLLSGSPSGEELCSLSVLVTSVTLVDEGGRETQNLLAGPMEVDLLGLSGQHALLALAPTPSGTYGEVRATIDPGSVRARDAYGNPVEVPCAHASASALPAHPIVVPGRGVAPIPLPV